MTVNAIGKYDFPSKDTVDKFHGMQLLYVGWDDHLMFCSPLAFLLPPDTKFGDVCTKVLAQAYGYHPEWAKVDFAKATWRKSGQPWQADMNKTLKELGLRHKDVLRLTTPGLKGIEGTGT
ncbi:MAG: phenol hydroxylase subunit P4 [Steroidobacteraceae bacterium]